jgi:hypothetical protein
VNAVVAGISHALVGRPWRVENELIEDCVQPATVLVTDLSQGRAKPEIERLV